MPRPCLWYPPWCLCLLVVFCAGHAVMLVGGAVRDLLLGCKPKDYDLLTSAHIAEVRSGILWQPDNVLFVEPSAMRALAPSGYRLSHAPTHGASRLACIHTQHCIAVHVGVDVTHTIRTKLLHVACLLLLFLLFSQVKQLLPRPRVFGRTFPICQLNVNGVRMEISSMHTLPPVRLQAAGSVGCRAIVPPDAAQVLLRGPKEAVLAAVAAAKAAGAQVSSWLSVEVHACIDQLYRVCDCLSSRGYCLGCRGLRKCGITEFCILECLTVCVCPDSLINQQITEVHGY